MTEPNDVQKQIQDDASKLDTTGTKPNDAGGTTEGADQTTTTTQTTEGAEGGDSLLGGEGKTTKDGGAGEGDAGKDGESLLADDKKDEKPVDDKAETEAIQELAQSIADAVAKDESLKEFPIDTEGLKAIAPALKKAGVDGAKGTEIVKAFATWQKGEIQKYAEENQKAIDMLKKEAREELGADLPKFIKEAKAGGQHVFGELWNDLANIPAFGSNVKIIKKLAVIGRSVSADGGTGGGSSSPADTPDFVSRWTEPKK